jgi:tryptophanyl-tRNA synthetase
LSADFANLFIILVVLLFSLTVHEAAHAWSASRLGDDTARALGRVSLNPAVHIDWIGTVVFPLVAMVSNVPVIGWAKPVPVNTARLGQPRRDAALVAAAGPVSNLLLAGIGSVLLHGLGAWAMGDGVASVPSGTAFAGVVLERLVIVNVMLALFNLVPLPPLDGGAVLAGLLHGPVAAQFARIRPYGFMHAELFLLLSMVVPVPWLERVPTYKEQQLQLSEKDLSTLGFLAYPLLQTADVALYDGRFVPVGEDQVAHLELSREAVRRFAQFFGDVLVEPQPLLTPVSRLPGLDNRKMSKSYGNAIDLSDDAAAVVKKVRQMYTDPKRVRADIPGTVEGNPVFMYHDAFNPNTAEVDDLKARYRAGAVGDVEVKTRLASAMNTMLEPMRERRRELLARPDQLRDIVVEGSRKARAVAQVTMARVRDAVRLKY